MPRDVKSWSLTTLREKLVKIGAKVTQHARYYYGAIRRNSYRNEQSKAPNGTVCIGRIPRRIQGLRDRWLSEAIGPPVASAREIGCAAR